MSAHFSAAAPAYPSAAAASGEGASLPPTNRGPKLLDALRAQLRVMRGLTREVQHHHHGITAHKSTMPNRSFNVDANKGHAFGIFMALIGALRASRSGAS